VKKSSQSSKSSAVLNRRARFDYELADEVVTGIELTGQEVRAVREGRVQLKGSFVAIRDDQLWLNNASFSLRINERGQTNARTVDTRPRRLLVHRKQIDELIARRKDGMSIVPTKILINGRFIKVVIALGKGKKHYDKRETIKRRDIDREHKQSLKYR
jgi:SsrA-binding protein